MFLDWIVWKSVLIAAVTHGKALNFHLLLCVHIFHFDLSECHLEIMVALVGYQSQDSLDQVFHKVIIYLFT